MRPDSRISKHRKPHHERHQQDHRKRGQFLILIHKVSAETGSGVSDGLKTDETYRCENRVRVGGRKTPSDGCSDGSAGLAKNNEVGCCRTRSSNPCGTAPSAVK